MYVTPEHRCLDCGGILLEDDAVVYCGCCGCVAAMRPASPEEVAREAIHRMASKEKKEENRWSSAPPPA